MWNSVIYLLFFLWQLNTHGTLAGGNFIVIGQMAVLSIMAIVFINYVTLALTVCSSDNILVSSSLV